MTNRYVLTLALLQIFAFFNIFTEAQLTASAGVLLHPFRPPAQRGMLYCLLARLVQHFPQT